MTRNRNRPVGGSWRTDGTYVKVKGVQKYFYRAVDTQGKTVDFLLTARRDVPAARSLRISERVTKLRSAIPKDRFWPIAAVRAV